MKNGTHGNRDIEELSVMRILRKLHEKALKETDGKVHIREIKDNNVGEVIVKY